jgi:hypothetical protein
MWVGIRETLPSIQNRGAVATGLVEYHSSRKKTGFCGWLMVARLDPIATAQLQNRGPGWWGYDASSKENRILWLVDGHATGPGRYHSSVL